MRSIIQKNVHVESSRKRACLAIGLLTPEKYEMKLMLRLFTCSEGDKNEAEIMWEKDLVMGEVSVPFVISQRVDS